MRCRALGVGAAAGALLCACATLSPRAAMSGWVKSSSFDQAASALFYDDNVVVDSIHNHDSTAAVRTYCAEMFTDAQGENTDLLPTPDDQLTRLLSNAYGSFIHAAYQCTRDPGSSSVRRATLNESSVGFFWMVAAVEREEAVTGTHGGVRGVP